MQRRSLIMIDALCPAGGMRCGSGCLDGAHCCKTPQTRATAAVRWLQQRLPAALLLVESAKRQCC